VETGCRRSSLPVGRNERSQAVAETTGGDYPTEIGPRGDACGNQFFYEIKFIDRAAQGFRSSAVEFTRGNNSFKV
jgi:hypothetical protein